MGASVRKEDLKEQACALACWVCRADSWLSDSWMEELHGEYVGRGVELPCPLSAHHSPISTYSPTQKLHYLYFSRSPSNKKAKQTFENLMKTVV